MNDAVAAACFVNALDAAHHIGQNDGLVVADECVYSSKLGRVLGFSLWPPAAARREEAMLPIPARTRASPPH